MVDRSARFHFDNVPVPVPVPVVVVVVVVVQSLTKEKRAAHDI